jgi:hypothetical protein
MPAPVSSAASLSVAESINIAQDRVCKLGVTCRLQQNDDNDERGR